MEKGAVQIGGRPRRREVSSLKQTRQDGSEVLILGWNLSAQTPMTHKPSLWDLPILGGLTKFQGTCL